MSTAVSPNSIELDLARDILVADPAAAAERARTILASDPENAAAMRVLGRALRRLNRIEEASAIESSAFETSSRSDGHRAAMGAIQSGNAPQGRRLLQQLISEDSTDVLALTLLGIDACNSNEFETAQSLLRQAVDQAPDEPSPNIALAELYHRSKRPTLALKQLEQVKGASADSAAALSLRAACLSDLGQLEDAIAIFYKLSTASGSNNPEYLLRMGHALRSLGKQAEAVATYRKILDRWPHDGTAWWSLANLKSVHFDDRDLDAMKRALAMPGSPIQNRIRLNFALGKAHEDRGESSAAFQHYAEGNNLRSQISDYDPQMISDWVDKSILLFTPQFFHARSGQGDPTPDPIFITGIQRSGSTLVEQILDSHPEVEGVGELSVLPNIVREMGEAAASDGKSFQQHLASFAPEQLRSLGQAYLSASSIYRKSGRPYFTDKMPNNWMYVGVIRLILPEARIIDVRREPMACCFSNWKQLYARGLNHSNKLETMGRYYVDYVRLMRHFDQTEPGRVHRVIYEDVVSDLDRQVESLLSYLDLPFDARCLKFHTNERAVQTISANQVRRPLNRDGMGQWIAFEPWLKPLKVALGDMLDTWRD